MCGSLMKGGSLGGGGGQLTLSIPTKMQFQLVISCET